MKTKIFPYILIALVFLFPFRYAYLTLTGPDVTSLLSMVATVLGTLIFMMLTFSDKPEQVKVNKKNDNKK